MSQGEFDRAVVFEDRSSRLAVMGIAQLGIGGMSAVAGAMAAAFLLLPAAIPKEIADGISPGPASASSRGQIVPALGIYALPALWFSTMGIGSILGRRWARALTLVASWLWLGWGMAATATMAIALPRMMPEIARLQQLPAAVADAARIVAICMASSFLVVLPGAFIKLYSGEDVKATCESRDPKPRWTDRRPLPVLALASIYALLAGKTLLLGFGDWWFPFFGIMLKGPEGAGAALIFAGLCLLTATGAWRQSMVAWGCAVALALLWSVSFEITYWRLDTQELLSMLKAPKEQIDVIAPFMGSTRSLTMISLALTYIPLLGFLVYARRYFGKRRDEHVPETGG